MKKILLLISFVVVGGLSSLSILATDEIFKAFIYASSLDKDTLSDKDLGFPKFKLRYDYPKEIPNFKPTWSDIDVTSPECSNEDRLKYMRLVLEYILKDNISDTNSQKWFSQTGKKGNIWYHAPALAMKHDSKNRSFTNREYVHGLTKEISSPKQSLHILQNKLCENWGIAMYNNVGASTIAEIWAKPDEVVKKYFPTNTVSFKILFTEANKDNVPYLENTLIWKANRNISQNPKIEELSLLQFDIAVKDIHSPTGWVFGTYVYHNKYNDGKGSVWNRLVPIGLIWHDNDSGSTWITEDYEKYFRDSPTSKLYWRLGNGGMLSGPADNKKSNCLSCHKLGERDKARFVKNIDYSQQMTKGKFQYKYYK